MITALQLIFSPFRTWEKISLARRRIMGILLGYLLPLLGLALAFEAYSLIHWGEKHAGLEFVVKIPAETVVRYSVTQFVFLLGSITIGTKFLQWVTHSFQVATSYVQCFNVVAYGFGPIILSRFLDGVPAMNTWACWGFGALLSASVLYHGIALVLRPEQTKGFGLYLVGVIIVVLSSLLSHFVALSVLHGKALD